MRKFARIVIALLIVLLTNAMSADARGGRGGHGGGHDGGHGGGHFRLGLFVGPGWWWPGWWDAYPRYPYYPQQHIIVHQPPDDYVQEAPRTEEPRYWYFCRDPEGYYPDVNRCPKGWLKVVPPEGAPDDVE